MESLLLAFGAPRAVGIPESEGHLRLNSPTVVRAYIRRKARRFPNRYLVQEFHESFVVLEAPQPLFTNDSKLKFSAEFRFPSSFSQERTRRGLFVFRIKGAALSAIADYEQP